LPEKSKSGIGISSGSQLPQSAIGIPVSGFSPVPLVTDQSGIAQLCNTFNIIQCLTSCILFTMQQMVIPITI
jgi:hypothetical protein